MGENLLLILLKRNMVPIKGRGRPAVQVSEGLIVIQDGPEFLDAGNGFVALEIKNLPGCTETQIESFLLC